MSQIRTPERERPATPTEDIDAAVESIRRRAKPLTDATIADLAEAVSDSTYVLLGEATHGTAEFYRWRAELTAQLIAEHGFDFVAVEGDWPDCYAVNRYVKGLSSADSARGVLDEYERWPTWMWANWEVAAFAEWLRDENDDREDDAKAGFYGMDVYSLFESMRAVVDYLEDVDPDAAAQTRDAYACFEPYAGDAHEYAQSTRLTPEHCEGEVVDALAELRRNAEGFDDDHRDAYFDAEQNALVAKNAEAYYRTMVRGRSASWNVRDRHMVETLERLRAHHAGDRDGDVDLDGAETGFDFDDPDRLIDSGDDAGEVDLGGQFDGDDETKAVVWAHNTHVGDARATDMARRGKVNVGQLIREAVGRDETAIVGFGTYKGTVVAGDEWGSQMERMPVPPAKAGSYGDLFHRAGVGDCLLRFDEDHRAAAEDDAAPTDEADPLSEPRGHRAIGVVYRPERELGNYVPTALPDRYDAFAFVDETEALHPLHLEPEGTTEPEAYPWGL